MQAQPYKIPSKNKSALDYILSAVEGGLAGYTQAAQSKKQMDFEREKSIELPIFMQSRQIASAENIDKAGRDLEQKRIDLASKDLDAKLKEAATRLKMDIKSAEWQRFMNNWQMRLAEDGYKLDVNKFNQSVEQMVIENKQRDRQLDLQETDINYKHAENLANSKIAWASLGIQEQGLDLQRLGLGVDVATAMAKFSEDPLASSSSMMGFSSAVGLSENKTIKLYNDTMRDLAELMSKKKLTDDEKARAASLISTMQNVSPSASSLWEAHIGSPLPKPQFNNDKVFDKKTGFIKDDINWKDAIHWDYGPSGFPQINTGRKTNTTLGMFGDIWNLIFPNQPQSTQQGRVIYKTEGTKVTPKTMPPQQGQQKTTAAPQQKTISVPKQVPIKTVFPRNIQNLIDDANASGNPEQYLRGLLSMVQRGEVKSVTEDEIRKAFNQVKK